MKASLIYVLIYLIVVSFLLKNKYRLCTPECERTNASSSSQFMRKIFLLCNEFLYFMRKIFILCNTYLYFIRKHFFFPKKTSTFMFLRLRKVKMDQRKLMDNANTITDMAKVKFQKYSTSRKRQLKEEIESRPIAS